MIINGAPCVGKDTFCQLCNNHVSCINISTVDKVKEAYMLLGWDGTKTPTHRKALSDIKDLSTETLDHPYKYVVKSMQDFHSRITPQILFIHSREPKEIYRFVKDYNCITLLIKNSRVESETSNHADALVGCYPYDYIIENNSSINDLEIKAIEFIEKLRKGEDA